MTGPMERLRAALSDRYRIVREVGSGGMATVYLAEDRKHGREVALKVLRPDLAATLGPERFLREIEIAARLHHPHVLPLYDSGDADGFLYYVMPYEEGQSVREKLARSGELPVADAVRLLRDVVDALVHAHGLGVVHRDIKPENIMLSGHHALVTDFGVAKAVSEATGRQQLTTAGVALGTPTYMAPEQAAADPNLDHRVDIYAIGVLAYELLTGRPPFEGGTAQQVLSAHMTQRPEPVTRYRETVPPQLEAVIMRCLEKRPADRWQSAAELLPHLEAMATPSGGVTPTGTQPVTATDHEAAARRAHPVRVAVLFGIGSVGMLALVYVLMLQLGLPDWVFAAAIGLLVLGLPVMLLTGHHERRRALARGTGEDPTTPPGGVHRTFTWRTAFVGGGIAFGALAVATAAYAVMRSMGIGPAATLISAGTMDRNARLLLADFANRTPDSTLGLSITTALRIDLAESPAFDLMDQDAVAQALGRARLPSDTALSAGVALMLAEREGVKAVVAGEVAPLGQGYVISATVHAGADRSTELALRETAANDGEVIGAVDRLSKRLRERIGESLRTIRASEGLPRVTTGSLEALRLYALADRAAERDGDQAGAIPLLEQAVVHDTAFAMAYRKLGTMLQNLGRDRDRRNEVLTRAYLLRDRVPDRERYHVIAVYQFVVLRDVYAAIDTYEALYEIAPASAANNLGFMYEQTRDWAAAEEIYQRGIEQNPRQSRIRSNLLNAQFHGGRIDAARATLDSFITLFPEHPRSRTGPMHIAQGLRDFDEWERLLGSWRNEHRTPGQLANAIWGLARVAQVRGQLRDAGELLRELRALQEREGWTVAALNSSADLAWLEMWFRGDTARAAELFEAALQRHPLDSVPPADRPYLLMVSAWADFGRPDRARAVLADYEREVDPAIREATPWRNGARGRIELAEGRPAGMIELLRQVDRDISCPVCTLTGLAQGYDALGQPDSVIALYERYLETPYLFRGNLDAWGLARAYKRLGELYEERGDRERAARYYGEFTALWVDADAEFQPLVQDVKNRIARLSAER